MDAAFATWELPDGWKWWDWFDYTYERPRDVVLVLTVEQYYEVWDHLGELNEIVDRTIFQFEFENHYELHFYVDDLSRPDLRAHAYEQQHLRWVRQLVAPDLAAVHQDVFEWFAARGDTLRSLQWRELEEVVASSFASQGMTVALGPGRADGGIDMHLTQHEVFGDVLTAVQVKSGRTPVKLHYVQALAAASLLGGNHESIFVTSSRYEPGARKWAERWSKETGHTYSLAGAADVETWCAAARDRLWLPDSGLRNPAPAGAGDMVGRVLVSTSTRLVINRFGLVVRQTPRAALMLMLSREVVEGNIQRGRELPVVPTTFDGLSTAKFVAVRKNLEEPRYWWSTDGGLFTTWDGKPAHFDTMD